MERRQWDGRTKAKIVLEGLGGRPLAEVCNAYQISPTPYYKWREQFLAHAHETFEAGRQSRREARLEQENTELKGLVGELAMELKKTDGGWR